jgi:chemotaxis signal transduction protein
MSRQSYILCTVAGATYALRSVEVQHMEMVEQVTPVPNAAPFVEGVVLSRGQVVPVVNLRSRFGFERTERTLRSRLLVVDSGGRRVGLLVDEAREFLAIADDAIHPPHEAIGGTGGDYLDGVATLGDRIVLILNVRELLNGAAPVGHSGPEGPLLRQAETG